VDYYFPLFLEASSQFGYSDLRRIDFSGIQYFTGDVSGMPFSNFSFGLAICNFYFGQMVGNLPKYKQSILRVRSIWNGLWTIH